MNEEIEKLKHHYGIEEMEILALASSNDLKLDTPSTLYWIRISNQGDKATKVFKLYLSKTKVDCPNLANNILKIYQGKCGLVSIYSFDDPLGLK